MLPNNISITMAVVLLTLGPAHAEQMPADAQKPNHVRNILFVSPAGKPFRPDLSKSDQHPMGLWFSSVDGDGDGKISAEEFRADFESTFSEYDEDGNEQIDAFEIRRYEQEIFPEILTPTVGGYGRSGSKDTKSSQRRGGKGGGRGDKGGRGGKGRSENANGNSNARPVGGAARFGLLPIYHPLLDADSDISWRVSKAEFMKAAEDRFRLLDTDQAAALTLEVLKEKLPKRKGRFGKR